MIAVLVIVAMLVGVAGAIEMEVWTSVLVEIAAVERLAGVRMLVRVVRVAVGGVSCCIRQLVIGERAIVRRRIHACHVAWRTQRGQPCRTGTYPLPGARRGRQSSRARAQASGGPHRQPFFQAEGDGRRAER